MIVIVAMDVRGGRCIPPGAGLGFGDDPGGFAQQLIESGAQRVQITNLDAAHGIDDPRSRRAIRAALNLLVDHGVHVQIAAGIRSHTAADFWLESGATEVIVSNLAVYRPDLAAEICHTHPQRILLGLDVRGSVVHPENWPRDAGPAADHIRRWSTLPAAGLIRTNLSSTGSLTPDELAAIKECIATFGKPVLANAIADSLADMAQCAAAGVAAVIVGRQQGAAGLDLREAIRLFPGSELSAAS